ncbi:MAG: histidine phosphatase family protein [Ferruginibacter sp.]|nr:histidine phosphatase family protein [Ferruginibacter sp.]
MKTIYIIRHAKSSWADHFLSDFERTLNARGRQDAPMMANRLKQRGIKPGGIVSSPAIRAKTTAEVFASTLGFPSGDITFVNELYHAPISTLWTVISWLNDAFDSVALFGHNPGLTELANSMTEKVYIDNLPTCGIFAVQAGCNRWVDFEHTHREFLFFDYPKNIRAID